MANTDEFDRLMRQAHIGVWDESFPATRWTFFPPSGDSSVEEMLT